MARGFFGSYYENLPIASGIENYRKELIEYYKDEIDQKKVKDDFEKYMIACYVKCTTINTPINDRKSLLYFRAKFWLCWCLLPFFFGMILFGVSVLF